MSVGTDVDKINDRVIRLLGRKCQPFLCVAMVTIIEQAKDDPMKGLNMIKEVGC